MKIAVKRILDLTCALGGIIVLSPLLGAIAIIAGAVHGHPILFTQVRPGLSGKPFRLYKFRTMTEMRDNDGHLAPDAERLTRFGTFLRNTSIDELPQLFNVIKGDMSLVGPRPLLLEYLPLYTPEQARRHNVKPGITGWAQIQGRQNLQYSKKLEYDVWYVDHWSFLLDLKILFISIAKVMKRENIGSGRSYEEVDDIGLTKGLTLSGISHDLSPSSSQTTQHGRSEMKNMISGFWSIAQRTRTSLRDQGAGVTILKLYPVIHDHLVDMRYGIDTCKFTELDELTIHSENKKNGSRYEGTRVKPLRKLFDSIRPMIPPDSILVDLGCGKGRVLLIASEFGFREVRGVEFAHELCEIAKTNCTAYKVQKGFTTDWRIIESDVTQYVINGDENIFFMANPFDEVVMANVLCRIADSLQKNPRNILIIYNNPKHGQVIEQRSDFAMVQKFKFWGHKFTIYANRN